MKYDWQWWLRDGGSSVYYEAIRLLDPDKDSQWIWILSESDSEFTLDMPTEGRV